MTETLPASAIKVVVVGHVDHGKSTLLGRVMLDCGRVPDDKVEHVRKICDEKSLHFEPAFLFDALEEEQEQGISIDTTRVNFEFDGRKFVLIDAPGHLEFLKNMTSGASEADLGILVVDCHQGVRSQTERHLKILSVLGVPKVIVALNKIDQINYDQTAFETVCAKTREIIESLGLVLEDIVPISALHGENITAPSSNLSWYLGQPLLPRLMEVAAARHTEATIAAQPLRMLLQDVYKFGNERHFAGIVTSGSVVPGQEVFFSPSGKISKIQSIEKFPQGSVASAHRGESIALTLVEQIFVERGEVISHLEEAPEVDTEFRGRMVWLSRHQFSPDTEYIVKIGTDEARCKISFMTPESAAAEAVANGSFMDVIIKTTKPLAFDRLTTGSSLENFVVCSTFETLAAGVIDKRPAHDERSLQANPNVRIEPGYVHRARREERDGHKGAVLWMTGLSGAGKSTLAKELEKSLFERGCKVVVLDGDNLRLGLCADLGFSPEERSENIRRIAHTSRLFLDAGFIVITACISPYAKDRQQARDIVGAADFKELFVFCPLEECQRRDPKGLYSKANAGQIRAVTGFDSPYQSPQKPALRLDSSKLSVSDEVAAVVELLQESGVFFSADARVKAGSVSSGIPGILVNS